MKLKVDIRFDLYTMTTETMIVSNKSKIKVEGKSGITIATNLACIPLVGVDWALRPFFL